MNYLEEYNNLIENAKNRKIDKNEYYENHHIIPKCCKGTNDKSNLVKLTLKEHYHAHELLVHIYKNKNLIYALWMMCITTLDALEAYKTGKIYRKDGQLIKRVKPFIQSYGKNTIVTPEQYEFAKKLFIDNICHEEFTEKRKINISNGTKLAMRRPEIAIKCKGKNKGTKWYYNKETYQTFKWHPGDELIDESKFSWGRPPMSKEQRKKLSIVQLKPRSKYYNETLDLVFINYDEICIKIPDNWKKIKYNGEINHKHNISKTFHKIISILHQKYFDILSPNIEYEYNLMLPLYSKKHYIISPILYMICNDILLKYKNDYNNEQMFDKCATKIYENLENIKELNKEYLNLKLIESFNNDR